ncbi:DUF4129 domain-containing protein [Halogranum rubrum]|uniref:Protein-glutamine gamma-glutamyltransferase-like C-terminal domain-containing protein n=1 Tax=Halogranum salarium B-1 TaxID=1210908 RepID=J2Z971_9EURY|nr:DUF4129 domain-containing protein [Halogranum salarium]EJN57165.1 hypothetical protein HSB1_45510 [Halogranum salarium B-1]
MRLDKLLDVGFALALVVAFGVSAAAMDGAMTTDPNDVVDLDTHLLPVGADEVGELKREVVKPNAPSGTDGQREREDAATGQSDRRVERKQLGAGAATVQSGGASESQQGTSPEVDWLQWLLQRLLLVALVVLGALGAVVTGVVAGRNREKLRALLAALLDRFGLGEQTTDEPLDRSATPPTCSNEVARAWYEMVCCLGLDCEQSKTPDECAAAAVDAGHDPAVVAVVTEAFQRVRYGDQPVTDELVAQVRAAVERIHETQQRRHGAHGQEH